MHDANKATAKKGHEAVMELDTTSAEVQVAARSGLRALLNRVKRQRDMREFGDWLAARIDNHLQRPAPPADPLTPGPDIPPGSPIGSTLGGTTTSGALNWIAEGCWHCDS